MKNSILFLILNFILVSNYSFAATFTSEYPAGRTASGLDLDAYEIFYSMYDQSIELKANELSVIGTDKSIPITFGAEKEGSSSKILRVMSPNVNYFAKQLAFDPNLAEWFINGVLSKSILQHTEVTDYKGETKKINYSNISKLKNIDWNKYRILKFDKVTRSWNDSALYNQFITELKGLVDIFPDSIFSFLKPQARRYLWDRAGEYPGEKLFGYYDAWVPLYGDAEKYIEHGHRELNKGWEVIFKPQRTYGDFEQQIKWFRTLMGSKLTLFEAPGHQRVVMPRITLLPEENQVFEAKAAELNRMVLSYLVLRGLKGQTGLLGAKHKAIPSESELEYLSSGRGPIRLERDRFYQNSIGVEFRTGMKDEMVRRFIQAVYASRLSTNDMGDLKSIKDWILIPHTKTGSWGEVKYDPSDYDVDAELLSTAINNWKKIEKNNRPLSNDYLIPLWLWRNAPFAKGKKSELSRLTKDFIQRLAELTNPSYKTVSKLVSDWVISSNLIADIEAYITPKRSFDRVEFPITVEVPKDGIDVNKIDLGNEFTARMPLKLKAEYNKNGNWEQTIYDMTPEERERKIKSVAQTLQEKFTGRKDNVVRLNSGSHGHSLIVAYELKDKFDRTWRVEWDGVSRNYDPDGKIMQETARGGHIEIVSPKYNPSLDEIKAVYEMMDAESLVPEYRMGGSHINIDFDIFEQNPQALARFLTLFHQHRGIISFMFQHINRLRSAEPVEISPRLDISLRNFNGTKEDLSRILYNEKYFNPRFNRKTRYTQLDISNYIGQVIPAEFIKPDFDVVKARFTNGNGWSRQFRVTKPKKLEFRLFDAAKDPLESALQIKLVRALLNKAINGNETSSLPVQLVNHETYVKNPQQAYDDLKTMVSDLGLQYSDYSVFVTNKIMINNSVIKSKNYENWFVKANRQFPKMVGWGTALLKARTDDSVLYSDTSADANSDLVKVNSCEGIYKSAM